MCGVGEGRGERGEGRTKMLPHEEIGVPCFICFRVAVVQSAVDDEKNTVEMVVKVLWSGAAVDRFALYVGKD
jgi:hypothetical protein